MKTSSIRRSNGDIKLVALFAVFVSLIALRICLQHGWVLLYGDAVAHINIARRVFDSKTPGLLQLGTVWLPLPHILMMPFLLSAAAWQSGAGGSVPSVVSYVLSVIGIFRLLRNALSFPAEPDIAVKLSAYFGAAVFALNPNLIYLQTTAMTEPLYIAFFIWAVVFFAEFTQALSTQNEDLESNSASALVKCGLCLAGAELTRYDGWFAALTMVMAGALVIFRQHRSKRLRRAFAKFVVIVAFAPVLWLAYNGLIYRNPLEFANGPYSARAIEKKSARPGYPPHPGSKNILAAAQYFLKSAEDNVAEGVLQRMWVALAISGSVVIVLFERRLFSFLLFWIPLPFYALSVAHGGVPIFLPTWWPFSYYNVRYGIQLLPGFVIFFSLTVYFLTGLVRPLAGKFAVGLLAAGFAAGSYAMVWKSEPVSFREAWVNSRSRIALETELASNLRKLPSDSTLIMYLGDHVGALQQAGIPLSRVIQEGNHRTWKQPADPDGLWERGLSNPAAVADFAVGIGDDPVARSAREHKLTSLAVIETPGQPRAIIYAARAPVGTR
jgi:hypothetical protein